MRYLIIPEEILINRHLRPLEKMLLAFIYNTTKNGGTCFASIDWLSVHLGTKGEVIENFIENLIKAGLVNEWGNSKTLAVSLEFIKTYTPKDNAISSGTLNKGEIWQKLQATSENFRVNSAEWYSPETKAEHM